MVGLACLLLTTIAVFVGIHVRITYRKATGKDITELHGDAPLIARHPGWRGCERVDALRRRCGRIGEEEVNEVLAGIRRSILFRNVTIFEDGVHPPRHEEEIPMGEIDHVLIRPNGVFTIETKTHRGTLDIDRDGMRKCFEGVVTDYQSPAGQVMRNSLRLKTKLRQAGVRLVFTPLVAICRAESFSVHVDVTVPVLASGALRKHVEGHGSPGRPAMSGRELRAVHDHLAGAGFEPTYSPDFPGRRAGTGKCASLETIREGMDAECQS